MWISYASKSSHFAHCAVFFFFLALFFCPKRILLLHIYILLEMPRVVFLKQVVNVNPSFRNDGDATAPLSLDVGIEKS